MHPDGPRLGELATLTTRGALTVEVAKTFSLEEAGAAFDASQSGHTRGKFLVVLP